MAEIEGQCSNQFDELKSVFAASIDSGADLGGSVAIAHRGEVVVDIWGGHRDEQRNKPWRSDTITNVFSSTKTMASLCALMLVDRGELDVDLPVARYWPEFAAAGKAEIPVRDLLGHTAGLAGWEHPMTLEDLYDWDKCTQRLAAQAPWWTPGSASGYHAFTQGYLVGEVVKRISGRTLGRFFADEVAGPLGADFYIGLPAELDSRVSLVIPPEGALPVSADHDSPSYKTFMNPPLDARFPHAAAWRRAEIPAANGHGNARGAVLAQAAISHGGEFNGVRLLSPKTIDRIFEEQANGKDIVLGIPLRFGIGYGLASEAVPFIPNPNGRICFWGGWGGSLVINDLDNELTFAYMMNKMGEGTVGDARGAALIQAMYRGLGN
ncbi:MAG: CubicO group peptidase (beta-lactamase class C family) [Gammaproteobacteria bacterium]|jgi:CubicO group peptidase (beta-lactamase class C family)